MNFITNESFGVFVLSNQERVEYNILSKDKKTGVIAFAFSFRSASKISLGRDPDILEVHLKK